MRLRVSRAIFPQVSSTTARSLIAGSGYDVSGVAFGDAGNGYVVTPTVTEETVEVTIPSGVAADKITVEVPPTAKTKPGLTYVLLEGTSIEGMAPGEGEGKTHVGDGKTWTPTLTTGGNSRFYSIGVDVTR